MAVHPSAWNVRQPILTGITDGLACCRSLSHATPCSEGSFGGQTNLSNFLLILSLRTWRSSTWYLEEILAFIWAPFLWEWLLGRCQRQKAYQLQDHHFGSHEEDEEQRRTTPLCATSATRAVSGSSTRGSTTGTPTWWLRAHIALWWERSSVAHMLTSGWGTSPSRWPRRRKHATTTPLGSGLVRQAIPDPLQPKPQHDGDNRNSSRTTWDRSSTFCSRYSHNSCKFWIQAERQTLHRYPASLRRWEPSWDTTMHRARTHLANQHRTDPANVGGLSTSKPGNTPAAQPPHPLRPLRGGQPVQQYSQPQQHGASSSTTRNGHHSRTAKVRPPLANRKAKGPAHQAHRAHAAHTTHQQHSQTAASPRSGPPSLVGDQTLTRGPSDPKTGATPLSTTTHWQPLSRSTLGTNPFEQSFTAATMNKDKQQQPCSQHQATSCLDPLATSRRHNQHPWAMRQQAVTTKSGQHKDCWWSTWQPSPTTLHAQGHPDHNHTHGDSPHHLWRAIHQQETADHSARAPPQSTWRLGVHIASPHRQLHPRHMGMEARTHWPQPSDHRAHPGARHLRQQGCPWLHPRPQRPTRHLYSTHSLAQPPPQHQSWMGKMANNRHTWRLHPTTPRAGSPMGPCTGPTGIGGTHRSRGLHPAHSHMATWSHTPGMDTTYRPRPPSSQPSLWAHTHHQEASQRPHCHMVVPSHHPKGTWLAPHLRHTWQQQSWTLGTARPTYQTHWVHKGLANQRPISPPMDAWSHKLVHRHWCHKNGGSSATEWQSQPQRPTTKATMHPHPWYPKRLPKGGGAWGRGLPVPLSRQSILHTNKRDLGHPSTGRGGGPPQQAPGNIRTPLGRAPARQQQRHHIHSIPGGDAKTDHLGRLAGTHGRRQALEHQNHHRSRDPGRRHHGLPRQPPSRAHNHPKGKPQRGLRGGANSTHTCWTSKPPPSCRPHSLHQRQQSRHTCSYHHFTATHCSKPRATAPTAAAVAPTTATTTTTTPTHGTRVARTTAPPTHPTHTRATPFQVRGPQPPRLEMSLVPLWNSTCHHRANQQSTQSQPTTCHLVPQEQSHCPLPPRPASAAHTRERVWQQATRHRTPCQKTTWLALQQMHGRHPTSPAFPTVLQATSTGTMGTRPGQAWRPWQSHMGKATAQPQQQNPGKPQQTRHPATSSRTGSHTSPSQHQPWRTPTAQLLLPLLEPHPQHPHHLQSMGVPAMWPAGPQQAQSPPHAHKQAVRRPHASQRRPATSQSHPTPQQARAGSAPWQ